MAAVTAAVAISAGSAYASHRAGKKAAKAQKKANEAQRKINKLKNFQAKRQFLRNFRQAQANVLSSAIASGVGIDSSAFQGTQQSQMQQANVAVKEFKQMDEYGGEMTQAMNRQASATARAQTWGAVSSFASSFIAFPSGGGGGGGTT